MPGGRAGERAGAACRVSGNHKRTKVRLAILREPKSPDADPAALALSALGWILSDENRAGRLLSLTGMTPEDLRNGLGDCGILSAVLDFLSGHEPDLIAAAEALSVKPEALIRAGQALGA